MAKLGTLNALQVEKEKAPANGENQLRPTPCTRTTPPTPMEETYEIENEEAYYEEGYEEYADEAYDEEPDDETVNYTAYDEDYPDEEDPEYEEAYATYLDARRRFAELRNNRGFYPVVALTDSPTSSSTSTAQMTKTIPSSLQRRKRKRKGNKSTAAER